MTLVLWVACFWLDLINRKGYPSYSSHNTLAEPLAESGNGEVNVHKTIKTNPSSTALETSVVSNPSLPPLSIGSFRRNRVV